MINCGERTQRIVNKRLRTKLRPDVKVDLDLTGVETRPTGLWLRSDINVKSIIKEK